MPKPEKPLDILASVDGQQRDCAHWLYQSHPVSLQVDANKVACVNHGPLTYQ